MTTTVTRDTSRQIRPVPAGCGQGKWPERRVNWPDARQQEACAPEGGMHADPSPALESMWRYRRVSATLKAGLALAAVLAVCGYASKIFWPMA